MKFIVEQLDKKLYIVEAENSQEATDCIANPEEYVSNGCTITLLKTDGEICTTQMGLF